MSFQVHTSGPLLYLPLIDVRVDGVMFFSNYVYPVTEELKQKIQEAEDAKLGERVSKQG